MKPLPPPEGNSLDPLNEPLRTAIEAIRGEPIPVESVRRAAHRAREIQPAGVPITWPRLLLLTGALAGSFLIGVAMRQAGPPVVSFFTGDVPQPADLTPVVASAPQPERPRPTVTHVSSHWADWERVRLPGSTSVSSHTLHPYPTLGQADCAAVGPDMVDVAVRIDGRLSRTTVHLVFRPAPEDFKAVMEYPLPAEAVVRSVEIREEAAPRLLANLAGVTVLRCGVGPVEMGERVRATIAYEQPLQTLGTQRLYSFPLPECDLQRLRFALEAAPNKRAIFLPKNAVRLDDESRTLYRVEHGPVRPSGAISYVIPVGR